jgi:hypothetical protein
MGVELTMSQLPPHFVELVYDAVLKSFWRKPALKRFLRASGISEAALAQLDPNDTKRVWLDQLFPKLETAAKGPALINKMARDLADQAKFPDLENWEDSKEKIQAATEAVKALRSYITHKDEEKRSEAEREEIRKKAAEERARIMRSQTDLANLQQQLDALYPHIGTQQGGYDFQVWFYKLMEFSEIDHRRPYMASGRQIDGSITIGGTTYLVELKFTAAQAGAPDVDSLLAKVRSKADNTMGIMVSVSGYSSVSIDAASGPRSLLLLLDHRHLYMVLQGIEKFDDVIRRLSRHSSQTGRAYLAPEDFGGGR